ncbi:hypothetical protein HY970_01310 [Candidatus Kaiserbacteria bacterium]|nr:hypothetical protein [Candidatus Kaiserbacteria bacterium]
MELYHILNRGVEKRNIFMDTSDRVRFVHDLYEFNDTHPAPDIYRTMWDLRNPTLDRSRVQIVDIHGWCEMKNHYHLLLSERVEGGLTLFLRKLNIGYANYFNEKYSRSGSLFQGRTKKIHITSDSHFLYILHYTHLNPLDFLRGSQEWRTQRVKSAAAALAYLDDYRWSSYLDYCGQKNFPSIITKDLFKDVFKDYRKTITSYLRDLELAPLKEYLLE